MTDTEDLTGRGDDWIPGLEDPPVVEPDETSIDPEDEALPIVPVEDLPDENPAETADQDDLDDSELEGLGADGQMIWRRAVPRVREKIRDGAQNKVGYCLQEVRIVNETPAKYLDAVSSLIAADVKHRVTDWSQVPRGTIGYFRGDPITHPHGHVFENFGNGWTGTTDSPLGHWGRVGGADLLTRWGYEEAFWSPFVNDNRVWRPKREQQDPPPTPDERRLRTLEDWRDELVRRHSERTRHHDQQRAHTLEARIQIVTRLIRRARDS